MNTIQLALFTPSDSALHPSEAVSKSLNDIGYQVSVDNEHELTVQGVAGGDSGLSPYQSHQLLSAVLSSGIASPSNSDQKITIKVTVNTPTERGITIVNREEEKQTCPIHQHKLLISHIQESNRINDLLFTLEAFWVSNLESILVNVGHLISSQALKFQCPEKQTEILELFTKLKSDFSNIMNEGIKAEPEETIEKAIASMKSKGLLSNEKDPSGPSMARDLSNIIQCPNLSIGLLKELKVDYIPSLEFAVSMPALMEKCASIPLDHVSSNPLLTNK